MIDRVRKTVVQVAEAALGIVGIRVGTEEPRHTSEPLTGSVEIRRYEPRIAAETTVDADEERARNEGFRRLAGYIFGGNQRSDSIAMTAPVAQSTSRGQTIAMTAPVSRAASADGWVIRFFMPSRWTMDTLPAPKDERVRLVEVPAETVAVLRFSGDRGAAAVAARTQELLTTLRDNGVETAGEPMSWFYDPPWTVSVRRRNEIAVPVRR